MFWRNLFIDYPGRYLFVIRDHWEGINFMDYSVLMHVVNKASPIVFFFLGFCLDGLLMQLLSCGHGKQV